MPNTSTESRARVSGFTLVEILVALAILSIVMAILHSTFANSSATARAVDERADELSSLTGALDTLSQEVRGAYDLFTGTERQLTFTAMTPFTAGDTPAVQTVSYEFAEGRLLRRTLRAVDGTASREFLLLEDVGDPAFAFFDGKAWRDQWLTTDKLPAGVRVTFLYKQREVDTVMPVWSMK